ncbi:hypothetical protein [Saccharibacillus sacchari]|uniref:hypothetical protein n=1 Tax=Saccharibacillus sacchari TaxID=456493 RepID=UPI0004B9D673|nr:hypothetical protein [Saccharibacillus sacchari]
MVTMLMTIGAVAYMSQVPFFPKDQKIKEYGYLALHLAFIWLIVSAYTGKLMIADSTLLVLGILLYLPVFTRIFKKIDKRRQTSLK